MRKPGRGSVAGFFARVIVSPILTSAVFLMLATKIADFAGTQRSRPVFHSGVKTPTSSTSKFLSVAIIRMSVFLRDFAADDADIDHDAAVGVVMGVEDEGAQNIIFGVFGRRNVDENAARESLRCRCLFLLSSGWHWRCRGRSHLRSVVSPLRCRQREDRFC